MLRCYRWDDASWLAKALDAYEANVQISGGSPSPQRLG